MIFLLKYCLQHGRLLLVYLNYLYMTDCWKKFMSYRPFQLSVICPYCNQLEWRLKKSVDEFKTLGCIKCRLLLNQELHHEDSLNLVVKKKVYNYKVTGRYE